MICNPALKKVRPIKAGGFAIPYPISMFYLLSFPLITSNTFPR